MSITKTKGQIKYEKYRESNLRNKREHYQKNKERIKAYQANYRKEHADKRKASDRKYRQTHKVECSMRCRARYVKTKEKIVKEQICNWYSRICGICDTLIEDKFEVDHIIPISKNGKHVLENLQLAHAKCNRIKRNRPYFKIDKTALADGLPVS